MSGLVEEGRAKVNLTLRVVGRRTDGYHDLESVVAFADCADRLTLTPGAELTLKTVGPLAAAFPERWMPRCIRRRGVTASVSSRACSSGPGVCEHPPEGASPVEDAARLLLLTLRQFVRQTAATSRERSAPRRGSRRPAARTGQ